MKTTSKGKVGFLKAVFIAGVLAVSANVSAGVAGPLIIDDFNGSDQDVHTFFQPGPSTIDAIANGGYAIGTFRTIDATASGSGDTTVTSGGGLLSVSEDSNTTGTGTVTWDGNGAGLGGIDLTVGGNLLILDIIDIDQGNVDFTFTVVDTFGGSGSGSIFSAGTGIASVGFGDIAGVDFTSVDSISLLVSAGRAADVTIDLVGVSAVPVPAAIWFLGSGLIGLAGIARRKA